MGNRSVGQRTLVSRWRRNFSTGETSDTYKTPPHSVYTALSVHLAPRRAHFMRLHAASGCRVSAEWLMGWPIGFDLPGRSV